MCAHVSNHSQWIKISIILPLTISIVMWYTEISYCCPLSPSMFNRCIVISIWYTRDFNYTRLNILCVSFTVFNSICSHSYKLIEKEKYYFVLMALTFIKGNILTIWFASPCRCFTVLHIHIHESFNKGKSQ